MDGVTRVVVPAALAGERLDRALAALTPYSRRSLRVAIPDGVVVRNGVVLRQLGRRVEAGDVLELAEHPVLAASRGEGAPSAPPQELPPLPPIVYRDRWLLALDKPAGMLSQSSARTPGELAADEVVTAHLAIETGRRPFVRLIHRLDRLTSGVLLFALDPSVTAPLAQIWARGEVERRYIARVAGSLTGQRRVDLPLGKVEDEWRFRVDPAGLPAVTEVDAVATGPFESLVRCRLLTGRTHQVRVHLAAIGHPVVGDLLYGGPPGPRVMLHAEELELPHPRDQRALHIVAPRPEAFELS